MPADPLAVLIEYISSRLEASHTPISWFNPPVTSSEPPEAYWMVITLVVPERSGTVTTSSLLP